MLVPVCALSRMGTWARWDFLVLNCPLWIYLQDILMIFGRFPVFSPPSLLGEASMCSIKRGESIPFGILDLDCPLWIYFSKKKCVFCVSREISGFRRMLCWLKCDHAVLLTPGELDLGAVKQASSGNDKHGVFCILEAPGGWGPRGPRLCRGWRLPRGPGPAAPAVRRRSLPPLPCSVPGSERRPPAPCSAL